MWDFNLHTTHQVAHSLHTGSPVKAPTLAGRIQVKHVCHSAAHAVVVSASPNSCREQALASLSPLVCLVDIQSCFIARSSVCKCILYCLLDYNVNRVAIVLNEPFAHIPQSTVLVVEYSVNDTTIAYNVPCLHSHLLSSLRQMIPTPGLRRAVRRTRRLPRPGCR